jgi:hypothetical protein
MKYNLSIISPKTWIHHSAVNEVVLYFYFMIKKKIDVQISFNKIDFDRINIFFFAWNLPKDAIIPKNSIIFQSEDLDKSTGWMLEGERGSRYIELLNEYKVVDYAEFNLQSDIIKHKSKIFLPLLYCEDLKFKFKREKKDFLLFYGSLTEHRKNFLNKINKYNVKILDASECWNYGYYRDLSIAESTAVLNIHKTDKISKFQSVRCFYSLINNVPVITQKFQTSENQDFYKESVNILDDLSLENTEKVLDELKNEKQQEKKFELFKSYNSKKIFFECLDNLNDMK